MALVCGDASLRYREYAALVEGFAASLVAAGASGRRVIVLLRNGMEIAVSLFAAQRAGATAAALNPDYTARELKPMFADARPAAVLCHRDLLDRAREAATACPAYGSRSTDWTT